MKDDKEYAGHFGLLDVDVEEEADEVEELSLEDVMKMVDIDDGIQLMVEEKPEDTNLLKPAPPKTDEDTAQRLAGQTAAKFKQVRAEKSQLKMKYMGGVRRY